MPPKAYLCGPIAGQSFEKASDWRKAAEETLHYRNWGCLNPMRGKEALGFPPGQPLEFKSLTQDINTDSVIVTRDLMDLSAATAVLVYVGYEAGVTVKPLTGTVCEVFAARHSFFPPKPCIAFKNEVDAVYPQVQSPWFGQFFTPRYRIHGSLLEAIEFMISCF